MIPKPPFTPLRNLPIGSDGGNMVWQTPFALPHMPQLKRRQVPNDSFSIHFILAIRKSATPARTATAKGKPIFAAVWRERFCRVINSNKVALASVATRKNAAKSQTRLFLHHF